MKYTWEEKDIEPGRWVTHAQDCKQDRCISYCMSGGKRYGLTDIMTDGLFVPIGSKAELAEYLTGFNWEPRNRGQ